MADISAIKLPDGNIYNIKDIISYNKILSRGEQLIVNGSGMIGDNTNFTRWTFDGEMANGSPGSFTLPAGTYTVPYTDEFFPVNPNLLYQLDVDFISKLGIGRMYSFVDFYDVDKLQISSTYHMYRPNTLTTLKQDLNLCTYLLTLTQFIMFSEYLSNNMFITIIEIVIK